ncbi:hypothetical protein OPQ81_002222 [Rhizoctonia solani]|nr:hypothetical protein OPQ81_002222 [Rhizoctonia solani]
MSKHHMLQINVAGANWCTHTILNDLLFNNFDIILIQDPWWGKIGSQKTINPDSHTIYGTNNSPNWLCIIPPGISDGEHPGVAIYICNHKDIGIHFSDITPSHLDILAIDIFINNSLSTIINIYPHGKTASDTIDCITHINPNCSCPTIICGDFNTHHPEWALIGSKWESKCPNTSTRALQSFIENNQLCVMNNLSTPTHYHLNRPKSNLIIDLTLLNYSAINTWAKFN